MFPRAAQSYGPSRGTLSIPLSYGDKHSLILDAEGGIAGIDSAVWGPCRFGCGERLVEVLDAKNEKAYAIKYANDVFLRAEGWFERLPKARCEQIFDFLIDKLDDKELLRIAANLAAAQTHEYDIDRRSLTFLCEQHALVTYRSAGGQNGHRTADLEAFFAEKAKNGAAIESLASTVFRHVTELSTCGVFSERLAKAFVVGASTVSNIEVGAAYDALVSDQRRRPQKWRTGVYEAMRGHAAQSNEGRVEPHGGWANWMPASPQEYVTTARVFLSTATDDIAPLISGVFTTLKGMGILSKVSFKVAEMKEGRSDEIVLYFGNDIVQHLAPFCHKIDRGYSRYLGGEPVTTAHKFPNARPGISTAPSESLFSEVLLGGKIYESSYNQLVARLFGLSLATALEQHSPGRIRVHFDVAKAAFWPFMTAAFLARE